MTEPPRIPNGSAPGAEGNDGEVPGYVATGVASGIVGSPNGKPKPLDRQAERAKQAVSIESPMPRLAASRWAGLGTRGAAKTVAVPTRRDNAATFSTVVVNRDDRLPTICGKLDAARLPDVAVLVPRGNEELATPVGMRLLMRHADRVGKSIVLVTRRPAVRQIARAEGQPFTSSEKRVRFGRRSALSAVLGGLELPIPGVATLAWLIGICLAGVLVAACLFSFAPSATLTLFPPASPVSAEQELTLDIVANRVDPVNGVAPATRRRIEVVRTVTLPATGSVTVDQVAGDPTNGPAVAASDLDTAKNLAPAALVEQALVELKRRYGSGWQYFPQTADVQVASAIPSQPAGARVALLDVTYEGTVSILGARDSDLQSLLVAKLLKDAAPGTQLIDSSIRLSVSKSGPFNRSADRLPLLLRMEAAATPRLDTAKIRRALEGKSRRDALLSIDRAAMSVGPPALRLSPAWAPWLPRAAGRIRIDLATAPSPSP